MARGRQGSSTKAKEPTQKSTPVKRGRRSKKEETPERSEEPIEEEESEEEAPPPPKRQRKTVKPQNDTESEKKTSQKKATGKPLMNKSSTDYDKIDFSCDKTTAAGEAWNFKISSWNVDGIRAWFNKGGLEFINHEKPDIFCLQETKCSKEKLPGDIKNISGYYQYWATGDEEGYAGVAIFSKTEPASVKYGLSKEFDSEGRIITAEFDNFFLICTYVPNAGRGLVTLPKRLEWNKVFRKHVKECNLKKPVIICGDMNVAHSEIDLANPKTNKKNAGFTQEERDGMSEFLSDGYVDTFRKLYPDKTGAYTFWTYMMNSRSKNVGWRLDYFIISERLMESVCENAIRNEVYGSDHCPITLFLHEK